MIKTAKELANACIDVAKNYKTSYIWGGIGSPITKTTLANAAARYEKNTTNGYIEKAKRYLDDEKAFYFDCVCLIKSLLWGWNGDHNANFGGAVYASNGVPDISANGMINVCSEVSEDFSKVAIGEVVWREGHVGIYIGDGLSVECTPSWDCGVQITAVSKMGAKEGYNTREWVKHGKLPYVSYEEVSVEEPEVPNNSKESTEENGKIVPVISGLPILRKGDVNKAVNSLQALLIANKHNCGAIDGNFGGKTEACVKDFQAEKGIRISGLVEEITWTLLYNS